METKTIKELLDIQKEFDARIPTKNEHDTRIALIVEWFEFINTLELFKNWKQSKGKSRETQLEELADVVAFSLSGMLIRGVSDFDLSATVFGLNNFDGYTEELITDFNDVGTFEILVTEEDFLIHFVLAFTVGKLLFSEEELVEAYKRKMEVNHGRQDGTHDTDKGYTKGDE
ncbi:dUTP diphosphatase [Abyssicoccus albus]|uniref:Dimeric dUTPase (All-alpha-NTP-PPase superfamily) n=1 Tax=Abyssicoccus albus TaxID=1817405 RepID=A0A3N5BHL1_9BACL|nr:dUTP diphosphatase [Abyssicoccus albus]RPF54770.1 dimeric dUTPase (all-alpha-NTP-PPase superfamily) [Abyssicoccus albus]